MSAPDSMPKLTGIKAKIIIIQCNYSLFYNFQNEGKLVNISATSKTKTITLLLIGRILTNIGDSLIYMSVLWYFNSR